MGRKRIKKAKTREIEAKENHCKTEKDDCLSWLECACKQRSCRAIQADVKTQKGPIQKEVGKEKCRNARTRANIMDYTSKSRLQNESIREQTYWKKFPDDFFMVLSKKLSLIDFIKRHETGVEISISTDLPGRTHLMGGPGSQKQRYHFLICGDFCTVISNVPHHSSDSFSRF